MIHVVTGHICSGKTTHVRQHAGPDDLVVDLDRLALALAADGTPEYGYTREVLEVARGVRWFAIDEAVRLHKRGRIPNVWIVHAYPTDDDLARYRRLGAGLREQTCEARVLLARARAERPPAAVAELERRLRGQPIKAATTTGVGSATTPASDGRQIGRAHV